MPLFLGGNRKGGTEGGSKRGRGLARNERSCVLLVFSGDHFRLYTIIHFRQTTFTRAPPAPPCAHPRWSWVPGSQQGGASLIYAFADAIAGAGQLYVHDHEITHTLCPLHSLAPSIPVHQRNRSPYAPPGWQTTPSPAQTGNKNTPVRNWTGTF